MICANAAWFRTVTTLQDVTRLVCVCRRTLWWFQSKLDVATRVDTGVDLGDVQIKGLVWDYLDGQARVDIENNTCSSTGLDATSPDASQHPTTGHGHFRMALHRNMPYCRRGIVHDRTKRSLKRIYSVRWPSEVNCLYDRIVLSSS
nr:hypothetical protein CFP56_22123 [Quercus suber]